jgi:hypothetical protein
VASDSKYYTFVESEVFTKQIDKKASLDVLIAIQDDLMADPTRGDVIRGTGGVRKARIADPTSGRGKRGSFRYLYLYMEYRGRIHLLYFYGKDDQSDLRPDQKKLVTQIARTIKEASE